ncbi:MAG TPA: CBS domain-containing protein [Gaiellaceae bacterium]|nr:CBS domain-containing protein [Gaiellaceae bacterium]
MAEVERIETAAAGTLASVKVSEAMHPGVLTCPPEAALTTVARMMDAYRVHCVVVFTDADDDVGPGGWGIVSDLDLAAAASDGDLEGRSAGGTAATPVVTVRPDESLRRAAQLMSEYGTAHLVVTEPDAYRPLGILSTLDIARVVARPPARD